MGQKYEKSVAHMNVCMDVSVLSKVDMCEQLEAALAIKIKGLQMFKLVSKTISEWIVRCKVANL